MPLRNPAQRELATQLLAQEQQGDSAQERAAAAARVYEKLQLHLAPLVGGTGFRALFARSITLTAPRFPFLAGLTEVKPDDAAGALRACLQAETPEVVTEVAVSVFGAFLSLLATYVGERLTAQLLRAAWPSLGERPHNESPGEPRLKETK